MRALISAIFLSLAFACLAAGDTYTITIDPEVRAEPATGRIVLFFITETGRGWDRRRPVDGPFFDVPQPITSIGIQDLQPGEPVVIDDSAFAFPRPLSELSGVVRVQAVLDLADNPERSFTAGPGNLLSDVHTVELSSEREDHHHITLNRVITPRALPEEQDNLKWIEFRSEQLSAFYGRDVFHRAGVALPPGYSDDDERAWPAIYVVPGYGGRHTGARRYAAMYRSPGVQDIAPMAVVIVLDAESPLGHHGFVDSPNHGPRGAALVQEFIPHLESQFRLAVSPQARIVTGHSSGGWTSLWLQLNWPEVFGACFSSAPDPIDFSAFQKTNLYEDVNLYVMADGSATPSYREQISATEERVAMTVREECLMEHAIHPVGGSGQQWDAWLAMFSPRDPQTGFPARMFDPLTGEIDRKVVEHWKQFDITAMAAADWERYGPIIQQRVRLACGELDSYYLQRAVHRFKAMVESRSNDERDGGGDDQLGYILLHEHATHNNLTSYIYQRWNAEMREHFQRHGLHE